MGEQSMRLPHDNVVSVHEHRPLCPPHRDSLAGARSSRREFGCMILNLLFFRMFPESFGYINNVGPVVLLEAHHPSSKMIIFFMTATGIDGGGYRLLQSRDGQRVCNICAAMAFLPI